jgi:hypothetical protein
VLPASPGPIELADDVRDLSQSDHVVAVTGKTRNLRDLGQFRSAARVHAYNLNQKSFDLICGEVRPQLFYFYNWQLPDAGALRGHEQLESLVLEWNTKITDLSPISGISGLRELALRDLKRLRDLAPIAKLSALEELDIAGGMWTRLQVESLAPVAALSDLQSLSITNIQVADGSLEALTGLNSLKSLRLSNQFRTDEYAKLAAALPAVTCEMLAPYVTIRKPIGDKDVMVVGKGKPLLNSIRDAADLRRYVDEFENLKSRY